MADYNFSYALRARLLISTYWVVVYTPAPEMLQGLGQAPPNVPPPMANGDSTAPMYFVFAGLIALAIAIVEIVRRRHRANEWKRVMRERDDHWSAASSADPLLELVHDRRNASESNGHRTVETMSPVVDTKLIRGAWRQAIQLYWW